MKQKVKLLSLTKLKSGKKKFNAEFEITKSNGKISVKNIKFGAKGMSDYTIHKDKDRRDRYINRHKKDLRTGDPTRAGYLSMYVLWNKPSFKTSLADYKRRLNTYNRTDNFPLAIKGSPLTSSKSNKFGKQLINYFGSQLEDLPNDIKIPYLTPLTNTLISLSNPAGVDPDTYIYDWDLRNDYTIDWLKMVNIYISDITIQELKQHCDIYSFICKYIISYCNLKHGLSVEPNETFDIRLWKENMLNSIMYLKKIINKTDINPKIKNSNEICSYRILKFFNVLENKTDDLQLLSEYNEYNWEIDDILTHQWLNIAKIQLLSINDFNISSIDVISNFIIDISERTNNGYKRQSVIPVYIYIKYIIDFVNLTGINPPIVNIIQLCEERVLEFLDTIVFPVCPGGPNQFGASKVPDNVVNKSLYQKIKNKIRRDVDKKGRRWGAYDSGRLVREYKATGGKYSGSKKSKTSSKKPSNLDRWYREKWIDACVWPKSKSCGRTKASIKSKVTYCRPSKVIDSNTPKTVQELTKSQIKSRCKRKSKNPKKIIK